MIGYALGNVMNMGVTLGDVRQHLPRHRRAVRVPRQPPAVRRRHRHHRRAAARPARRLVGHRSPPPATRRSTRSTATCSAGGRCGSAWPRAWASRPPSTRVSRSRSRTGWGTPTTCGPASVKEHGLVEPTRPSELASWWHTDADLGREVETFADMSKSRAAGLPRLPGLGPLVPGPVRHVACAEGHPAPGLTRRSPVHRSERGGTDHAGRGAAPGRRGARAPPAADRPRPPVAPPARLATASSPCAGRPPWSPLEHFSSRQWSRCSRRTLSGSSASRVVGLGVRIPEPQPAGARPRAIRATYRVAPARSGSPGRAAGGDRTAPARLRGPGALRDRAERQPGRDGVGSRRLPIPVGAGSGDRALPGDGPDDRSRRHLGPQPAPGPGVLGRLGCGHPAGLLAARGSSRGEGRRHRRRAAPARSRRAPRRPACQHAGPRRRGRGGRRRGRVDDRAGRLRSAACRRVARRPGAAAGAGLRAGAAPGRIRSPVVDRRGR